MSVFFIGDLHLGHRKILEYSPMRGGTTIDEHDEWIVRQWNSVVRSKHDLVWVLGDVCFEQSKLSLFNQMNGRKRLILGNHDNPEWNHLYGLAFEGVYGLWRQYGLWLSHAPLHPEELRGRKNVHGHMHHKTLDDPRYFNVSVERLNGVPIQLEKLREILEPNKNDYKNR